MPSNRRVRVHTDDRAARDLIRDGVARIQAEMQVSAEFPDDVLAAAEAAARAPRLPELDRTDLPFVTIDPEGARDLDQALHIARADDGFVVHYAIADVAAFVSPGDPVDLESHRRGETLYGAESKVPLHPPVLSEDAASLVPDAVRPALLWTVRVDAAGEGTDVHVERALVRSRRQLSYEDAQRMLDEGDLDDEVGPTLRLLREVGTLRVAREAARGGVSLPLPEQVIDSSGGAWHLEFRTLLPVEEWNSQISLLTGFGAATLMLYARVGLLRTLPDPDPRDVQRLHRVAAALGVDWPAEETYPDFVRRLDSAVPAHAAVVVASARLLRGSGYVAFDGEVPDEPRHAALASEYAHVTAPLRRLADRYAAEACVAICAGEPVPAWVLETLPDLPRTMQRSAQRARAYERAVIDLAEAALLAPRVGEEFDAVVVSVQEKEPTRGTAVVAELGLEAPVTSTAPLPLGTDVRVRLASAVVEDQAVTLTLV